MTTLSASDPRRLSLLVCSVAVFVVMVPSLGALVMFRVIQAIGASMLPPTSLSIIASTFPDRKQRAAAMGIWGAVSGLSMASGPLLGGILIDLIGWRAMFWGKQWSRSLVRSEAQRRTPRSPWKITPASRRTLKWWLSAETATPTGGVPHDRRPRGIGEGMQDARELDGIDRWMGERRTNIANHARPFVRQISNEASLERTFDNLRMKESRWLTN